MIRLKKPSNNNITEKAKVTMLVISYNEKEYLTRAIESCVNQTYENKEILIGDDGSNDGSLELLQTIHRDMDIDYFVMPRSEQPSTIIPSFRVSNIIKRGLDISEGEYFVILSGDDFFEDPMMLERAVFFLENNDEYNAFIHGMRIVSEEQQEILKRVLKKRSGAVYWSGDYIHISCFVFRRVLSQELLKRMCDDTGFEYVLATKGKWKYDNHISFSYFQRAKSIMHKSDPIELYMLELLLYQDILNYGKQSNIMSFASMARFYVPFKNLVKHHNIISDDKYRKYKTAFSKYDNDLLSLIAKGNLQFILIKMWICWLCFTIIRRLH